MPRRTALLVAACALALTGCGPDFNPGQGPKADPGPVLPSWWLEQAVPGGIEAHVNLGHNLSAPWSLAARSRGRSLRIYYDVGGCDHHLGTEVIETSSTVELAVVFKQNSAPCAGVGMVAMATVQLAAPLGSRTLLHAPTSTEYGKDQIYRNP